MAIPTQHRIRLGGQVVDYLLVCSKTASKLRVRVGPAGVEVVHPMARSAQDVAEFLSANDRWILDQLDRVQRLHNIRRPVHSPIGRILFRGELTRVRVEKTQTRIAGNLVRAVGGEIVVSRGAGSRTPVERSLELWLRREARQAISAHLTRITPRLGRQPTKVYVMGQRTKWGNCSSRGNLSFNWRLMQAPDYVLKYLVTHEAVHLAIPDHSAKFWLTVQSHCPETERARQWLCSRASELRVPLREFLGVEHVAPA